MNIILAFDISANFCSVAISKNKEILYYESSSASNKQAELIIPMIERALVLSDLSYSDLTHVATNKGPGSFTGIRIALSTAKAIVHSVGSLRNNIKGLGISQFDLNFYRAKSQVHQFDKIMVIVNAYREQLYCQNFDKNGKGDTPELISLFEGIKRISFADKYDIIAGSGIVEYRDRLKYLPLITLLPRFPVVKAISMCHLAEEIIQNKQEDEYKLEPLYIRAPDAKIPTIVN